MKRKYFVKQWQTAVLVICGLFSCLSLCAQQRYINEATNIVREISLDKLKDLSFKISSSDLSNIKGLSKEKEAYYIYTSPAEKKGFVIVSGDKRMPAILGYSDNNDFDVNNIPPNVKYWLDYYAESYVLLQDTQTSEIPYTASGKVIGEVLPLLSTKWDQGIPFNQSCPLVGRERCATGCVATAMAQVMNKYKYPNKGKGGVSYITSSKKISITRSFDHEINWAEMLDDYSGRYTSAQADAIAELMFSCGASVKMDYDISSGAYQWELVTSYVDYFKYDEDAAFMFRDMCSTKDWHSFLIDELENGRPVNYGGGGISGGGHSFIFDGYKLTEGSSYPEYHVNWGWGGDFDGYYIITDLTPYYNNFNYNQQITLGIKPDDGIAENKRYICSSIPSLSSTTVKRGDIVHLSVEECYNMSYKPFKGTLHVMLISPDNVSTVLGETRIKSMDYLECKKNISIDVTIPKSLADGAYSIQLCSKIEGTQDYYPVFSKQYPKLTVSSSGEVLPIVVDDVILGSSELQIVGSSTTPSLLHMNVYEFQNLDTEPFTGKIQMILADCDGNYLASFGNCFPCERMNKNEVVSKPIVLEGNPKGSFSNGDYRIYVGAKKSNSTAISYVLFYDMIHPYDKYAELYVDAQIHDGNLSIGNYNFEIESSDPEYLRGDVNGDGIVNGTDIQAIINLIVESLYDENGDINEDGTVNGTDIQEVINIIVNAE